MVWALFFVLIMGTWLIALLSRFLLSAKSTQLCFSGPETCFYWRCKLCHSGDRQYGCFWCYSHGTSKPASSSDWFNSTNPYSHALDMHLSFCLLCKEHSSNIYVSTWWIVVLQTLHLLWTYRTYGGADGSRHEIRSKCTSIASIIDEEWEVFDEIMDDGLGS